MKATRIKRQAAMSCLLFQLSSLLLLLLLLSKAPITAAQSLHSLCSTNALYTAGSAFQSNLNRLLSSLYSATPPTGFSNNTIGQSPDTVYGLAMCRGDVSYDKCQDCLATALSELITTACPLEMSATIWYTNCFLRYSNQSFFGVANSTVQVAMWAQNSSDVMGFDDTLGKLMDNLTTAAANRSARKFAAGSSGLDNLTTIYGLVQCTADLTPENCYGCLQAMMLFMKRSIKLGAQFYGFSCELRYESSIFYNVSGVSTPPPISVSPPPSPLTGNGLAAAPRDSSVGGESNHDSKLALIIATPVATVAILLLGVCCLFIWRRRKPSRKILQGGADDTIRSSDSLLFDFATLRTATDNFSDANKLGEGGFGPVYKGELGNGEVIAVKRLAMTSGQGLVELRNEVALVAKLQHRNLVRLLGFCLKENEKMLVYEYLPNTSLDKFLFDPMRRQELGWQIRFKIIEGIARGLLYLHEDSRLRIIHRDLKTGNILLDANMNPKISDFGLAKLFGIDETQRNASRIAGTPGYMAPEYAFHGLFSTKSDVYSYGVLILEIITGQRNTSSGDFDRAANLLSYVWLHWNEGTVLQLRDPSLGDLFRSEELQRCIHIGLLCVQEDQAERPSMASVVLMLSSFSLTLPNPSTPAFFLCGSFAAESEVRSANRQLDLSEIEHKTPKASKSVSVNHVTISEMEPR